MDRGRDGQGKRRRGGETDEWTGRNGAALVLFLKAFSTFIGGSRLAAPIEACRMGKFSNSECPSFCLLG